MKYLLFVLGFWFLSPFVANANLLPDRDHDGVPDYDEVNIYMTNPDLADTDMDGYIDSVELENGYSPHTSEHLKLEDSDLDGDGLSDRMELNFKTNLKVKDTDGDGFSDGVEIEHGYDPLNKGKVLLDKRIEINLDKQELSRFLGGVRLDTYQISSGISDSTPHGHFKIYNKSPKAWSSYGLWMPYWMAITATGKYGIHELPVWPNGYREGENHLGRPVSHGCVRLGTDSAKLLYEWTAVGTPVFIY